MRLEEYQRKRQRVAPGPQSIRNLVAARRADQAAARREPRFFKKGREERRQIEEEVIIPFCAHPLKRIRAANPTTAKG